jgi:hypothetical protein
MKQIKLFIHILTLQVIQSLQFYTDDRNDQKDQKTANKNKKHS